MFVLTLMIERDHGKGYLNTNVLNVLQAPVEITETTGERLCS